MEDNTRVLPIIEDQELLAEYYSLADVFVICSRSENFPTTCIEAQCCGTLVAGFATGGTQETSVHSNDDFVEYGDLQGLSAKIRDLWKLNAVELAEKAQEVYSKETMARRYMEEYDKGGKKNKLLLIDVNCKNSSTGKIVYDLYESLRADGRTAAVCYGRGEKIQEDGIYKFGLDWETNIHAGLARLTGYNGYFSPISTKRLIRYIEEYNPDMIHIHELHAYFVNIKPLLEYIREKKIPLIWTFHCEYMYTGKCGYAYECTKFQTECEKCPVVKGYPTSMFFDKTGQMFHMKKLLLQDLNFTIATPSNWLADRVGQSFLKNKDIKVIYNGVDTEIFHPRDASHLREELGIPDGNKVVLTAAPRLMSERKGGQWVLKLADMMKNEKVTFILLGGKSK